MQLKETKFRIYADRGNDMSWANYTQERHLAYNAYIKPDQLAPNGIQFVATARSLSAGKTPLLDLVAGNGSKQMINSSEWEWRLYGKGYRPCVVLEDYEPDNAYCGRNQTKFKLKLDCDYYVVGDVLYPTGPKKFQVRIQEEPVADGDGYVYTVQLMTDDITLFVPKSFMRPGAQWQKGWSSYSEGRIGAGSTMGGYEMPYFIMRSWVSKLAKKYRITGDAAMSKIRVEGELYSGNGSSAKKIKEANYWYTMQEAIAESEWNREIENVCMYSRSTKSVLDEQTGLVVRQGPGLQELLEEGNVQYYNKFSIKLVEDFLRDIFFDRVSMKDRNIYMLTGQVGLELFDEAIKNIAGGQFSDVASYFIDDNGNKIDRSQGGSLAYGNYYKVYNMQWGKLIPIHFPLYDSRELNTELNPDTGYPAESQRFTFLDFGLGNGMNGSNIKYVEKENSDALTYTCGTYTPYGPNRGQFPASHSGDWFEIIRQKSCGMQLTDPNLTGELILNLQY